MVNEQQSEIEEYANKELRVLRQKLLDLTRRNKLLNFRHRKAAKNQLRIVDESLGFSFDRLLSGKDFQIAPLPSPNYDLLDPEDKQTQKRRFCKNTMNDSALQKLSVLIGAIVTAFCYIFLRSAVGQIDTQDKFWCAIPFFASMITTNRCIIGRLVRFIKKRKS